MEKLVVPDLPNATEWGGWKAKIAHVVIQGSGRAETGMVAQWIMDASSSKVQFEDLRHCPKQLVSLDGKLMTGIQHMLKNSKHP